MGTAGSSPDPILSLMERVDRIFDLDRSVSGATLRERLAAILRDAARAEAPGWGSEGDAEVVRRREVGALSFLYRPHLFAGMDADLRLGHRVQYALLPRELPPGSPLEITAVLESYCHLSGDVFGWRSSSDGALLVWLLDVSGHGVGAGFAAVVWKLLIDEVDPDLGLDDLARRIEERFDQLRNPDDPSCVYATGVLLRVASDGGAEYLSAGHPAMLLRRDGGVVEKLGPTCTPLALLEDADRIVRRFDLDRDDVLLVGTDGLIDAGEFDGEPFGLERVARVVAGEHPSLGDLAETLYRKVEDHHRLERLDDDLSFLVMRRRAPR